MLKNKTALVSASSAGIGLAIAQSLATEGAIVYINGRSQGRVDAAIQKIKESFPEAQLRPLVSDLGTKKGIADTLQKLNEIDILVNNLGIYAPVPFTQITDDQWFEMFEVNVMSGIRLSRYYFPKMLNKNWGRIIFISSESGINIPEEMVHYGMSKTAQLSVARGMATLTKGTQVTVNSVLPGPTQSEGVEQFIKDNALAQNKSPIEIQQDFFKTVRPTSLIQRFATPMEIANLVTYLASPLSSATNGASLRAEGGILNSI